MTFTADLHIHSRYSRATSRQLSTSTLAAWAMIKGIDVLGTGDFTHPAWREELQSTLELDEDSGLYRLKKSPSPSLVMPALECPHNMSAPPLFLLQAEISSIYKRHGKVRKVHNLVFMPHMDSALNLCRKLEGIGNLKADGRPILGLDSRNLLEIVLETDPQGVVVPAHIWTPWFAIFGSKSGFDSMEECFDDLTSHIFALETGLSSDPAMNRLWSHLDRYSLISNSDAHSGANLAREANIFSGRPRYADIFAALDKRKQHEDMCCRFEGTVEFFPEEGKYHMDGHRACQVVLEPQESRQLNNICPVCGKALTIGVLHRVLELADRKEAKPSGTPIEPFVSLIPLPELLGELLKAGPQSRKVQEKYSELLAAFGSELGILRTTPVADLRHHWEALGEGIARMRAGQVIRQGGYDGEYGKVRVFTSQEAASLQAGRTRAALPGFTAPTLTKQNHAEMPNKSTTQSLPSPEQDFPLRISNLVASSPRSAVFSKDTFTQEQQKALVDGTHAGNAGPILVMAGPGTGKTHTLLGRMAHLLQHKVAPQRILAVTFTRRAAGELRERLEHLLPHLPQKPQCDTLHALGWQHLVAQCPEGARPLLLAEEAAQNLFDQSLPLLSSLEKRQQWHMLALARERMQRLDTVHEHLASCAALYTAAKKAASAVDYSDLLELWLEHLKTRTVALPWQAVLVDEVQDLSPLQWALVRHLVPKDGQGFFGIGDAEQAIYAFRGAQPQVREHVRSFWPTLREHSLTLAHRSTQNILHCAAALPGIKACLRSSKMGKGTLLCFQAPNDQEEARWVAKQAANMLGGNAHSMADIQDSSLPLLAPGDMAVLVRTKAQIPPLRQALEEAGVPCSVPEHEGCWHHPLVAWLLKTAAQALGYMLPPNAQPLAPLAMPTLPSDIWQRSAQVLRRHLQGQEAFDSLFWESTAWKALHRLREEEKSWDNVLSRIALLRDVEGVKTKAERVQIITLHASKGLEFRAIFLPGLEQGLFPLHRALLWQGEEGAEEDTENLAEETRLCYVGITRAEELLFCSWAHERRWQGRVLRLPPSPFTQTIAAHGRMTIHKAKPRRKEQLSLL